MKCKTSLLTIAICSLIVVACDKCSKKNTADTTEEGEDAGLTDVPADAEKSGGETTSGGGIHERADVKQAATSGQLEKIDLAEGSGTPAQVGQTVYVHYEGFLLSGKKFDSSRDRNQEYPVALGKGQVITGWEEGLIGMKVGGKRILVIPPDKGYGDQGAGDVIPPKSVLLFEVEVTKIE